MLLETKKNFIGGICIAIVTIAVLTPLVFAQVIPDPLVNKLMETYKDERYYNEVCWLTSHNSFAYPDPSFYKKFIMPNQEKSIYDQLKYGVRGFTIDLYLKDNKIIIAHSDANGNFITSIKYYEQGIGPFLYTIKNWLNDPKNANDIITIHLESYVRDYKKIIGAIDAVDSKIFDVPALKSYLFDLCEYNGGSLQENKEDCAWPAGEKLTTIKWPTLGEMRNENKRLVIFSDKSEDIGYGIMHVSNTMETQYDLSKYPNCEMRSEGRERKGSIFVMNHFYGDFAITGKNNNQYSFLKECIDKCYSQEDKLPNFIAVDLIGNNPAPRSAVLNINQGTMGATSGVMIRDKDMPFGYYVVGVATCFGLATVLCYKYCNKLNRYLKLSRLQIKDH